MTSALATIDTTDLAPPVREIHRELVDNAAKLSAVMPPGINRDAFLEAIWQTVTNPKNQELWKCTVPSLLYCCQRSAELGLLPNGQEAAIVPFKGQAQLLPMVWGLAKRCRQSGDIGSLYAHVVYSEDEFDYMLGTQPKVEHRPCITGNRGEFVCAYAVAVFKDGMIDVEIGDLSDIQAIRDCARSDGIWSKWFDEKAKVGILRRLMKRLPQSADPGGKFQEVWDSDFDVEAGPGTGNLTDTPAVPHSELPAEAGEGEVMTRHPEEPETRAQAALRKGVARKAPARKKAPRKNGGPQGGNQGSEEPDYVKGDDIQGGSGGGPI